MKQFFSLICLVLTTTSLYSADDASGKLSHESEAGVILSTGNSDTQTYSVKQATSYFVTGNTFKFTSGYLLGKTSGTENAKKWDLGLRYERLLTGDLSGFVGYQIDSNPFSGTDLRHMVDVGGKYQFLKTDNASLFAELGYRMTAETFTTNNGATTNGSLTSHMSRAYLEWMQNWNKAFSSKLWVEYLQSFTITKDSRFNVEPSLSVVLSEVFSLKMAYLITYRNVPAVSGKKQTDTLFTTSLVAKF